MSQLYDLDTSNDPDVIENTGRAGQAQQFAVVAVPITGAIATIAGLVGPDILISGSNGVTVSPAANTITISLSQNLQTTGTPTFTDLTISDDLVVQDDASITGDTATGTLTVGGGDTVKRIEAGTVAGVDPGSIAAQTRGSVDVTVTGVAAGDIVTLNPPDGLNTGLAYAGCRVTAGNTVRIYLANITGGAIDDGALTWDYLWYDLT